MNKEDYQELVKRREETPKIFENALISFITGGILGALSHILTCTYMTVLNLDINYALGLTCMTFILIACILTGLGVFDKLVSKYKFGLIIPITGFAHSVASSILDYKKDGLITGMGSNAFKLAGSVILYGTISGILCAIIKVIIYG